jgi:hypothetical protein
MPDSYLTLGWQVTPTLEPRYWLTGSPKPGQQSPTDLVKIAAENVSSHTAIIAQSGSGKSFFLGRLVEELLLNTKARCLIFDPNADFRRAFEVESKDLWESAQYSVDKRGGKLPHEPNHEKFKDAWSSVPIRVLRGDIAQGGDHYERLTLRWLDISIDFLTEDLSPELRGSMYHCHAFVRALEPLITFKAQEEQTELDLIDEAEHALEKEQHHRNGEGLKIALHVDNKLRFKNRLTERLTQPLNTPIDPLDSAIRAVKYISPSAQQLYFAKAREYQAAQILNTKLPAEEPKRGVGLEVIDLPSLPDKATRFLAINAILANRWAAARKSWADALTKSAEIDQRVPTFVVVDEAHNLIPAEPDSRSARALREQFRTIVAEGRKYGLFLIVVSQRPDKLDPMVLSECENKAIMKLSSRSVVELTQQALGLEDLGPKLLGKCLEFDVGRVLLAGNWTPEGPVLCYSAARRTVEGGRNLRKKHWTIPYERGDRKRDRPEGPVSDLSAGARDAPREKAKPEQRDKR